MLRKKWIGRLGKLQEFQFGNILILLLVNWGMFLNIRITKRIQQHLLIEINNSE